MNSPKPTPIIRYCMAPSDSPWEPLTRPEAAQRLAIFRRHRQVTALRQPGRYRLTRTFDWFELRTKEKS